MQRKYNWYGYGYKEKDLYIREHEFYYTPTEWIVEYRLSSARLGYDQVDLAREMARFYYFQMISDKNYVSKKFQDTSSLTSKEVEEAALKEVFYQSLWEKKVPGTTPLDKAINALRIMKKSAAKQGIPTFEPLKMDMEQVWDGVPDEEQWDSLEIKKLLEQRNLDDFEKKLDVLQKMAAVEDFGKSFEIKKAVNEKRVTNSMIHKQKRMSEYEQILNSPLYQRLLPNYQAKLMTKDLIINQPVETTESKQKIIILVDYSGSMNSHRKQDWILSILADRLQYCVKQECEIFFSYFLTYHNLVNGHFQWTHIYDEKTALEFFKTFSTDPNGGDTEIGHVVEGIRKEIMENRKLFNLKVDLSKEQPEILVLNDGQDTVKTNQLTWKTNAITLYDGVNQELKRLCEKTEGKYVFVDHTMDQKYS